jgi:hypothetical protein
VAVDNNAPCPICGQAFWPEIIVRTVTICQCGTAERGGHQRYNCGCCGGISYLPPCSQPPTPSL